jgi:spore germination protein KB
MQNVYWNKSVSSKQLMYATAVFIIASNVLTNSLYEFTKNQSWFAVILGTVLSAVIISGYGRLTKSHKGQGLYEISETVFGKIGGKVVNGLYVFFFLTLTVFNTRNLGEFVASYVLPTTPVNITYAFFVLVLVYAVKKGADKMTRYGSFIFFIYFFLLMLLTVMLIPNMHLENLLPVFTIPLKNQLLGAHLIAMLPFCEIFAFMSMTQHMQKPALAGVALRRGLFIGAVVILWLVTRDIVVMGDYVLYTSSPTFNTVRMIDVGDLFTRVEIINAVLQIILLFFKVSILLFATVTGISKLFNIEQYGIFAYITGALVIICANFFFESTYEHAAWYTAGGAYATFFLIVIPLATLIVSMLRKKGGSRNAPGQNLPGQNTPRRS